MADKTKASLVVMSHLSDAQELISYMVGSSAIDDINFVKYIILKTKGDLTQEIDADALYGEFRERGKKESESIEAGV